MNRLFVFDVDGTLLSELDGELTKNTVHALNALLSMGDAICIASGRSFSGIHAFLSKLGPGKKYAGIANGSMVKNYEGETLYARYLTVKDLNHFVEKYKGVDTITIYGYGVDDDVLFYEESYFSDLEVRINYMKPALLDQSTDPDTKLLKIMVAASTKEEAESLYLDEEEAPIYDSTRSGPLFFEVVPKGVSKGDAVEALRLHLRISKEDVYCFGDSINDVSMIEMFHGIAMGNACDQARAVAEYVTLPCDQEGVYHALKNILKFVR